MNENTANNEVGEPNNSDVYLAYSNSFKRFLKSCEFFFFLFPLILILFNFFNPLFGFSTTIPSRFIKILFLIISVLSGLILSLITERYISVCKFEFEKNQISHITYIDIFGFKFKYAEKVFFKDLKAIKCVAASVKSQNWFDKYILFAPPKYGIVIETKDSARFIGDHAFELKEAEQIAEKISTALYCKLFPSAPNVEAIYDRTSMQLIPKFSKPEWKFSASKIFQTLWTNVTSFLISFICYISLLTFLCGFLAYTWQTDLMLTHQPGLVQLIKLIPQGIYNIPNRIAKRMAPELAKPTSQDPVIIAGRGISRIVSLWEEKSIVIEKIGSPARISEEPNHTTFYYESLEIQFDNKTNRVSGIMIKYPGNNLNARTPEGLKIGSPISRVMLEIGPPDQISASGDLLYSSRGISFFSDNPSPEMITGIFIYLPDSATASKTNKLK